MDAQRKTHIGFLITAFLLLIVAGSSVLSQSRRVGAIYVSPEIGACSGTKLQLDLDGISPLPHEVILKITRDADHLEVVNQQISLSDDGKYYWSGLLAPLGEYRAELFDAKNRSIVFGRPFAFNNIEILKDFIKKERGEIIYISRGGEGTENVQTDRERKTLTVNQLPTPTGKNQIHIVVINDRANKADEYFGPPPRERVWSSKPLRSGRYHLIVAEYRDDQSCQMVKGR